MPHPTSSALMFVVAATCQAQQQPSPAPKSTTQPVVEYHWHWLQTYQDATKHFPTEYRVGGVYRLKKDVVVERGGTNSPVSLYWTDPFASVDAVKENLSKRSQSLFGGWGFDAGKSLLSAETLLRFRQIWVERNFEMGLEVHPYVEVLDGPLRGKWVDIGLLSESNTGETSSCRPKLNYVEYAPQ